ncbi:AzlC family ABC transporter permease [Flexibacterium corallicola]|uniref:AzlC family ABC transporter permease n=1 Tax=Flexibacterium corallicola TaxID=3037259 RepID=UPI00286F9121|nr:AzlC family ABC transporter permease [Pseudovibrio sp. M1P-2-3]
MAFITQAQSRQPALTFNDGILTILPLLVAVLPIGFLCGALAVQKGLTPLEITFMSATVFAGASQFVALDLWAEPLPWFTIIISSFLVNMRHVLMGASFAPKLPHIKGRRLYGNFFLLTDELWALCERKALTHKISTPYIVGIGIPMYVSWVSTTFFGAYLGAILGDPAEYGLDFAFTALFIYLVLGFWNSYRTGLVIAASGITAVLVYKVLPGAWYIIAGSLAGMVVAALLPQEEKTHNGNEGEHNA